jgi:hypothetical protein
VVTRLRDRLPELARHPAFVATASAAAAIGAGLAVDAARQALGRAALARTAGPTGPTMVVGYIVVEHVHVVHHVVHHLSNRIEDRNSGRVGGP